MSAPLIIDGATGTELERAGVDISLPLWSARAVVEAPDALREIHRSYLQAGAGAITTCTFRTNGRALRKVGWGDRARAMTGRAVEIAREAREEPDLVKCAPHRARHARLDETRAARHPVLRWQPASDD